MVKVVKCGACGEATCQPGAVSCEIVLTHTDWCQHCHQGHTRQHRVWFCNPACMLRYVDEKADTVMRNAAAMQDNPFWPSRLVERNGCRTYENAVEE